MIYFISGHRDFPEEEFGKYLVKIVHAGLNDKKCEFVVGDCEGVDKFAMDAIFVEFVDPPISRKRKANLTIYHIGDVPKNTPLGLSVEKLKNLGVKFIGGFTSDEERDSAMTKASDFDIAFVKDNRWDSGTAQNIKRRHNI